LKVASSLSVLSRAQRQQLPSVFEAHIFTGQTEVLDTELLTAKTMKSMVF
jgi:hypothetical protein